MQSVLCRQHNEQWKEQSTLLYCQSLTESGLGLEALDAASQGASLQVPLLDVRRLQASMLASLLAMQAPGHADTRQECKTTIVPYWNCATYQVFVFLG